jgi:hypothetical protein
MNKKVLFVLFFTLVLVANGWTQYQERTLKEYTTYQTSLTKEDIMKLFVNEVRTYLQRYDSYGNYYLVNYEVEQDKNNQNWSWMTETVELKYEFGTVYRITLYISNASLNVRFCNTSFGFASGQSARQIVTTRAGTVGGTEIRNHITDTAIIMFNESEMVLKIYNDRYSDNTRKTFINTLMEFLLF